MTAPKAATSPAETPKAKRQRSPQHAAAAACIELARLDEADARAAESAKERTERRAAILAGLSPEVRAMVEAWRKPAQAPKGAA